MLVEVVFSLGGRDACKMYVSVSDMIMHACQKGSLACVEEFR